MHSCERDWYVFWEEDMSIMCLGLDVTTLGLNISCL